MLLKVIGPATNPQSTTPDDGQLMYNFYMYDSTNDSIYREKTIQEWQKIISTYNNVTFEQFVWKLSQDEFIVGAGGKWTDNELNAFGAMGIGSGGFRSVFQINALDILRMIVNGFEFNQKRILTGASSFINKIIDKINAFNDPNSKEKKWGFINPVG